MARDLRDVVNKIMVAMSDSEPTSEEIAGLASDLATFFDASIVLVYLGSMPMTIPSSEGPIGHTRDRRGRGSGRREGKEDA